MRVWLGKRFRLPLIGGVYAGVSGRVPTFKDPGERAAFWFGVLLCIFILTMLGRASR
jgi:hypothetical protein